MKRFSFLLLLILKLSISDGQINNYVEISKMDTENEIVNKAANIKPTPRQLRWQKLELTAFYHFGVNTYTDKEWGDGTESPAIFNPTNLDTRQWVTVAKAAGIKQVIITAKHHDGFCLWPSKFTEHSVKNAPWKNGKGDVVKELSEVCKEMNIGFGVYLSPWDRNHVTYGTEAYNDYFVNQLTELLTDYGTVDEVWFDGANGEGKNGKKQEYDFSRWYQLIRKLQPQAVIAIMGPDVRWVGTETGYGREQEWSVVPVDVMDAAEVSNNSQTSVAIKPTGDMRGDILGSREKIVKAKALAWYPAETDVSIRPGWFYHSKEDDQVKSPEKLIDIYFNSVGRNGVLLLNIPPDKRGLLSDADIKSLEGWKKLRDELFNNNLAKKAKLKSPKKQSCRSLFDENDATGITWKKIDSDYVIELDLKTAQTFSVCNLQEDISKGQRVESFILEGWQNGVWVKITEGTTIGYKRLLQFESFTSTKVRLRILSSRLQPTIAELGLFAGK